MLTSGGPRLGAAQTPTSPSAAIYTLAVRHSGKCLDVRGIFLYDGAAVQQWTCHGGATLASWYGVAAGDLPIVFPNIGRFAPSTLGFMA